VSARGWLLLAAVVFALVAAPSSVRAHGDLHDQIASLSEQMKTVPQGSVKLAVLYLHRGELYRLHGELAAAESDFDFVAQFDPERREEKLRDLDLARGRLYLDWGKPTEAKQALDLYVSRHGDDPEGLIALAQTLVKLGWGIEAVAHLDRAIAKHPQPEPDHFLGRAEILEKLGKRHLARAVRGLDEGIRRIGPVVTLETKAIDLELRLSRWRSALGRVDRMLASQQRKDLWLARKAEILELAGQPRKAAAARAQALAAHDRLPPTVREQAMSVDLRKRLVTANDTKRR
jgi:tetratricopeptide (TPR) repeat protein